MRGGNREQHRASTAAGAAFEALVEAHHVQAGRRGALAHVVHNQARSRVVGGKLIYEAAGIADYTGCLHGGRYLATEAKSTSKDRLPKSEITAVQQRHLDAVMTAGGLAFLLVEFRGGFSPHRYAIPWAEVPWRTLRTAESLSEVDINPNQLVLATGPDYLVPYHAGSNTQYCLGKRRVIPA